MLSPIAQAARPRPLDGFSLSVRLQASRRSPFAGVLVFLDARFALSQMGRQRTFPGESTSSLDDHFTKRTQRVNAAVTNRAAVAWIAIGNHVFSNPLDTNKQTVKASET